MSGFGVVLAIALSGSVFAFAPTFLRLAPASYASDGLLSVALALLVLACLGLVTELIDHSSVFQEEAWTDLGVTAVLTLPPAVPFAIAIALELPAWAELLVKSIALLFCLPLALGIGATLDSFFIKPRLGPPPSRAERRSAGTTQATQASGIPGAIVALITWTLANLANLLTVTQQLFPTN